MSKYAIFGTDAEGVETIKGNGWDIDAERIELNGINTNFIGNHDLRLISLSGPAVEDIFKCIRDLIKKNEALNETNGRLAKENHMLEKYCEEQKEEFNMEINKRDGYIDILKTRLDDFQ